MPAPKTSYVVVRPFDRLDRQTGATTHYEPGDPYDGPDIDLYLAWPDDWGPLIRTSSPSPDAGDDRKAAR